MKVFLAIVLTTLLGSSVAKSQTVINVSTMSGLSTAIGKALPGHVITMAPGTYKMLSKQWISRGGTSAAPVVIRAATAGSVKIYVDPNGGYAEGFVVNAPYVVIENLEMIGTCTSANHTYCEHAIHIKGNANGLKIRNNYLHEFNAMIKGGGNRTSTSTYTTFSNDVLIEGNRLQNSTGRVTSNPVTFIDVNGGQRWKIRGNRIADFYKAGGDGISYGAFLKGNSRDGIIENNVVACSKRLSGGYRLGLSFGGGGNTPLTGNPICAQNVCTTLHTNGIMRNNVVMNCSDVGVYLNRSANTKVYNNTLINTKGVDVRYSTSTAYIRNNVSNSVARTRDGGTMHPSTNAFSASLSTIFKLLNPGDLVLLNGTAIEGKGTVSTAVTTDICGQARGSVNDIGAIHYGGSDNGAACAQKVQALYNTLQEK